MEALLEALPANFAASTAVDCATGPALQAAFLVMSHVGGKLLLFQVRASHWLHFPLSPAAFAVAAPYYWRFPVQ